MDGHMTSANASPSRVAVVLMNLGGPDQEASIRPFLKNFFMDRNIIDAPWPVRFLVSRLIAWRRGKGEALEAYSALGGKSPLLENTELQRTALERTLSQNFDGDVRCFVSMRYWHPMSDTVARQVADYQPDKVILLPLYPQFSTTTSFSSLQDWHPTVEKLGLALPTASLACHPFLDGFIDASADLIRHTWSRVPQGQNVRLLFSAHGLPEKVIEKGDPYQWQCEQSAARIAAAAGLTDDQWQICYQSRVGPLKWIGPSTEEALDQAAADGVGVLVYPHAFVSEHVETLVEIEDEYREYAAEKGITYFQRVPTVMTHPKFITGLRDLILAHVNKTGVIGDAGCPVEFSKCCQRLAKTGELK
tara:strand:+ start:1997 stop:3079 length:1083 start_codon:yes stop_codon:yes gene_type:complete